LEETEIIVELGWTKWEVLMPPKTEESQQHLVMELPLN
jgi:hypothetical protein